MDGNAYRQEPNRFKVLGESGGQSILGMSSRWTMEGWGIDEDGQP